MSDELAMMTASELLVRYRRKEVSPVEATRAALARIDRLNASFNAFALVDPDSALAAARESETRWMRGAPRGLIDGVPATIKDAWLATGWPTRKGSLTVDDLAPATEDSPTVARMREQDAVFIGKTTMCELGWKGVTDSPLTGVSRNPWNREMTCGGSSGGAAIAAALGMGALNIGSDGAGSIRIPAAFCGVYGFKATFGRVPTYPTGRMQGISHVGPIVRSVADAALMMTVIARPDWRDWQCLPDDGRDYRVGLEDGVRGLRIAYSRTLGYAKPDAEIVARVDAAVRVFAELGAVVCETDPGFTEPRRPFDVIWNANLQSIVAAMPADKVVLMDPGYVREARRAPSYSAEDVFVAGMARAALGRHMAGFHRQHDLLITPALPLAAFAAGRDYPDGSGMSSWMDWNPYLYPFNWTQQPAASMPCGFTAAGLPVAMQIVGARHADALVLRASRAYESARPIVLPWA